MEDLEIRHMRIDAPDFDGEIWIEIESGSDTAQIYLTKEEVSQLKEWINKL